jgi:hypothetical protein
MDRAALAALLRERQLLVEDNMGQNGELLR